MDLKSGTRKDWWLIMEQCALIQRFEKNVNKPVLQKPWMPDININHIYTHYVTLLINLGFRSKATLWADIYMTPLNLKHTQQCNNLSSGFSIIRSLRLSASSCSYIRSPSTMDTLSCSDSESLFRSLLRLENSWNFSEQSASTEWYSATRPAGTRSSKIS